LPKKKIILLFGPTASGKSRLAIDIAKKYNCEIINADSMQIYKEIKVLSARPGKSSIKHHFYGFVSAKDNFSVGAWYKLVSQKIKEINKKGKTALVVGGTGLYFRALTEGLVEMPDVPKTHKGKINEWGKYMLTKHYHNKKPGIFAGVNLNDLQRVYRAINVFEHTGLTLHEWQQKKNKKYFKKSEFIKICIIPPKQYLEEVIKKRFDVMLKKGALKEVKDYRKKFIDTATFVSANNIIGIYEIGLYLQDKISLPDLQERVLIRTRQYAKRQYTWQRGQMKNWKTFKDTKYNDLLKKVLSFLSKT